MRVPGSISDIGEPTCVVSIDGQTLNGEQIPIAPPPDANVDEGTFFCAYLYDGTLPTGQLVAEVQLASGGSCSDSVGVINEDSFGVLCFNPLAGL